MMSNSDRGGGDGSGDNWDAFLRDAVGDEDELGFNIAQQRSRAYTSGSSVSATSHVARCRNAEAGASPSRTALCTHSALLARRCSC